MDSSIPNSSAWRAARERAVFAHRDDRGVLRVEGSDRLAWLNGLLTNDVRPLEGGGSCYAAWLTPQGRMITDLHVIETGSATLLDVPAPIATALAQRLDGLIFAEDVRVQDATPGTIVVEIGGPETDAVWETVRQSGHQPLAIRRTEAPLPGLALYLPRTALHGIMESLAHAGAVPLDDETAEVLRVEAGVPKFLVDMGEDTIPLEAHLDRAISHTKGCYVGQEIIVRIRDRAHGRVAKHLVRLRIDGSAVPPAGQPVLVDGKTVGTLTSAVRSVQAGGPIGLAMLHRDASAPGTRVSLADGTRAEVVEPV